MPSSWRSPITAVVFLLAVASFVAAEAPPLRLVGRIPLPGDLLEKQIILFFDAPVVVPPGADGKAGVPFTTEPPVKGAFRVEGNYIVFTPEAAPKDALLTLKLNPGLHSAAGGALAEDSAKVSLPTSPFMPVQLRVFEEKDGRARVGFKSPYPVKAADMQKHVAFGKGGKALKFELLNPVDGMEFQAWIDDPKEWPVEVSFTKGLSALGSAVVLGQDARNICPDLPPVKLTNAVWGAFEPAMQEIELVFSEAVELASLRPRLVVTELSNGKLLTPEFTQTEKSSRVVRARVHMDDSAQGRVSVVVQPGVVSESHSVLVGIYNKTLGRNERNFDVGDLYWNSGGKDGLVLEVNTTIPLRGAMTPEELTKYITVAPPVENLRAEYRQYGSGFQLKGEFQSKTSYTVVIKAGMPIDQGATLNEDIERTTNTGRGQPYAGFPHENQYYFPRKSGMALPLESRNVEGARVRVHRLFPNNLAFSLQSMNNGQPYSDYTQRYAQQLSEEHRDIGKTANKLLKTPLDLDTMIPKDKRGVFVVEAIPDRPEGKRDDEYFGEDGEDGEGGGYYYHNTSKIVVFSDLGVLAHWQGDSLAVFVHNLYTLAPAPNAGVTIYSSKNQQMMQGKTDANGVAILHGLPKDLGKANLVVVEAGEDYAFLELNARNDDLSAMDKASDPYIGDKYEAFLYADRDLYRPGETAHLHWIARDAAGRAVANAPIDVQVLKPNGQELTKQTIALSALGTGGYDLTTDRAYPTGQYTAQLLVPGDKRVIGSYTFKVEDFVPNRMKAEVKLDKDRWQPGNTYNVTVNAQHLFGAPAGDRKAHAWIIYQKDTRGFANWKGYTFDNDVDWKGTRAELGDLRTDAEGHANFTYDCALPSGATTPLRAFVFGEVFELGGRSVLGKSEATLVPGEAALGVAADTDQGPQKLTVRAAAVAPDGNAAPLKEVRVSLERESWGYYLRRYYTNVEPNWTVRYNPVESRTVQLQDGKGSTTFDVSEWGHYRVKIDSPGTTQYSTLSFFSYGSQIEVSSSARASLVKLSLDKEKYEPGQTARLRVESPFDGKAIVVLQNAKLNTIVTADVKDKVGVVDIPVAAEYFPNVWAEVTVIHKVKDGEAPLYPYSSFNLIDVPVRDTARELKVAFEGLPEAVPPAGEQTFNVAVSDAKGQPAQGEITLAAIDEGIHGITNYRDPDPLGWFGRARRTTVNRAHFYDKVVFDYDKLTPGGDLAAQLARRAVPPLKNWVKPVALWSGVVALDAKGHAAVKLPIPEFAGQLRLVAVAAGAQSTGAAKSDVYVRRAHMMETNMPRFVLPGDTATCRAVLYNHTDQPCVAELKIAAGGALAAQTANPKVEIPAKGEANAAIEIAAGNAMGQGTLDWEVVFRDATGKELERIVENDPLPVNPPAAYQTQRTLVTVDPGKSVTIENKDMVQDDLLDLDFSVAANPAWRIKPALQKVLSYPFGCVEQTTSKCFPLFVLRQSEDLLGASVGGSSEAISQLKSGIARLFAMQTDDGGLGYWPAYNTPYPYGSVYALHFLTLAKTDGALRVPERSFNDLRKYVRALLDNDSQAAPDLFLRAYALYVLALGGEAGAAAQVSRFDATPMPRHARYLLAAVIAMQTGDRQRAQDYLKSTPMTDYNDIERGGTLNSPIRNLALELIARMQTGTTLEDANDPAQRLISWVSTEKYANTQEQSFVITALATYLSLVAAHVDQATAQVKGPKGDVTIAGPKVLHDHLPGKGVTYTINNTGKTTVFADAAWRGVPLNPQKDAVKQGIAVTRMIHAAQGEAYGGDFFKQGENYIVKIEINPEQAVENLVAVDPLPGGLEIVNPRLDNDALPASLSGSGVTPNFLDLRDDRVVFAFDRLDAGPHAFYYLVQAVTPGTYQKPATVAECMYDATLHGATAAGSVKVAGTN